MHYKDLSFVLAGPGHSGSTWLGHALRAAPRIYVTHEVNYLTWSARHGSLEPWFSGRSPGDTILGEHSNNYFSWPGIPERLAGLNPDLKIVVLVRDPVRKTVSNYLHDRRWGILPPYVTLRIAVLPNYFQRRYIDDSDYPANLGRWLDWFPPQQLYLFRSPADGARSVARRACQDGGAAQLPDLIRFLGGSDAPEALPPALNEARLPLLPQMHRHAAFGPPGLRRALCRAFDRLNCRAGARYGAPAYTDADLDAVRKALGEAAGLSPLARLAEKHEIAGHEWLSP